MATALFLLLLAVALIVGAAVIGFHAVTNHGPTGAAARTFRGGRSSPAAGVWLLIAAFLVVAVWLFRSALRAITGGGLSLAVLVPFLLLLVFGTAGEIADLLGTASGSSNLIGAGILIVAAVPVILMSPVLWRPLRRRRRSQLDL